MYTFKAQAKSNAKRFLVQTCKLEEFNLYLTQHDGQWGTWLNTEGKPVLASDAIAALQTQPAANEADSAPPAPDAFSRFAMAQLTVRQEAQPEPEPVPAASTGIKIEKNRPQQNGITRPSAGTTCLRVWDLCDSMTASLGRTVPLSAVIDAAKGVGINQFTARTQYACWRKFNGIFGRVQ